MTTGKEWTKEDSSKNFRMVPTWKTKKGKASEFVDVGVTSRMRERGIGDFEWVEREGRRKKNYCRHR